MNKLGKTPSIYEVESGPKKVLNRSRGWVSLLKVTVILTNNFRFTAVPLNARAKSTQVLNLWENNNPRWFIAVLLIQTVCQSRRQNFQKPLWVSDSKNYCSRDSLDVSCNCLDTCQCIVRSTSFLFLIKTVMYIQIHYIDTHLWFVLYFFQI
jgi:hypothetical protein